MREWIATFSIFHSQFSITVLEINNEQDYKNCGRIRCGTAERRQVHATNKLVGQKVAIVSSKPQTTRTRITGVLSRGETQYVLLDTPGLHKPRSRLGDYMCKVVTDTVSEVDVAVLVVEPIPNIGPAEESLIAQIKQHHMPAILVINKIDTVKKEELLAVIATYTAVHEFDAVVPISARTGEGVEELLTEIDKYAIEGPQLFPEDMVSEPAGASACR